MVAAPGRGRSDAVNQTPSRAGGISGALTRLSAALVSLVHTRAALASVEFAEERERAVARLVLLVVAAVAFGFAALFASALVAVWFWDTYRLAAIAGVMLFWAAVGAIAMLRLGQRRRSAPRAFAATLAELERDRAWLEARAARLRDGEE
jgi:uncharacterized membrane protein YqjE